MQTCTIHPTERWRKMKAPTQNQTNTARRDIYETCLSPYHRRTVEVALDKDMNEPLAFALGGTSMRAWRILTMPSNQSTCVSWPSSQVCGTNTSRPRAQFALLLPHIATHRSLPNGVFRMLLAQTHPDPVSRMPLLARGLLIRDQHLVDESLDRTQSRRFSYHPLAFGMNRAG
jgi:hypothetical protein